MAATANRKIQATKNYRLFSRSDDNRPVDIKKHKKLLESMKKYGFLGCFPIVCFRDDKGTLIVKDGQHRLTIAESLGLAVHWVEEPVDFDIAEINTTAKIWQMKDYAERFAQSGIEAYQRGLDFAKDYKLPICIAFSMLAGNTGFTNIKDEFISGDFQIKDESWATSVARIYSPLCIMSPSVCNARFLEACMAVTRVPAFEDRRLLSNAERCREKLVSYSHRDAYLQMIEDIYNYGRKQLVPLKLQAVTVMRERSACFKKEAKSAT